MAQSNPTAMSNVTSTIVSVPDPPPIGKTGVTRTDGLGVISVLGQPVNVGSGVSVGRGVNVGKGVYVGYGVCVGSLVQVGRIVTVGVIGTGVPDTHILANKNAESKSVIIIMTTAAILRVRVFILSPYH